MEFFKKRKEDIPPTDLSYPLLTFHNAAKDKPNDLDVWRLEDATRGVQTFGGIGSGKTSASGRDIALSFLRSGYGGIILTGKVDEKDNWVELAKEAGRSGDLVIFEVGSPYRFNFLQYELNRQRREGGGYADNIVALFLSIIKMGNRVNGGNDLGGKEPFWLMATERLLKAAIDLLRLAKLGKEKMGGGAGGAFELTVSNLAKVLRDMPLGEGHHRKFNKLSPPGSFDEHAALQEWADRSFTIYCLTWANAYINHLGNAGGHAAVELESEQRVFESVSSYFLNEFPNLAEKTRSSILEHFFAFASPFRSGLLADYFASGTSPEILPEETFKGKIILLNFPVKQYLQLGVYAQSIYRKLWQQAVERRQVGSDTLPVFAWLDEAQYFVSDDDMLFQTTARASRACTVMISQNISNYYAVMGSGSKPMVDSLLGNLATKIFHNNNDAVTNEWAAETIGKDYRGNITTGDGGTSIGQEFQYQFLPKDFTTLACGCKLQQGRVEAVVTVAGRKWSNNKNFMKVAFQQKLK
jgi:hypothetical protein